jgi:hypothetical protein
MKDRAGYVYVINTGKVMDDERIVCKIGCTNNLNNRLIAFRCADYYYNTAIIEFTLWSDDKYLVESTFHQEYGEYWIEPENRYYGSGPRDYFALPRHILDGIRDVGRDDEYGQSLDWEANL